MRTDFGTRRIGITKSREPKCTCSRDSFFHHMPSVSSASFQLSTIRLSLILDTLEIHTRKWTSLNFHQVRFFKPLGTVSLSSSEDSQFLKSRTPTPFQTLHCSIKNLWLLCPMQETQAYWYAQLFAPIWDVFQCHILVPIKDGYVCATDPSTTNSVEYDKDQPKQTCHISTTQYTELPCALRSKYSPTSHQFNGMSESSHYFEENQ